MIGQFRRAIDGGPVEQHSGGASMQQRKNRLPFLGAGRLACMLRSRRLLQLDVRLKSTIAIRKRSRQRLLALVHRELLAVHQHVESLQVVLRVATSAAGDAASGLASYTPFRVCTVRARLADGSEVLVSQQDATLRRALQTCLYLTRGAVGRRVGAARTV